MNPALLAAPPAREPDDSLNRAVESALDELTTRQRNAVKFCVMFGWSLAKAAAEMRCDATTVMRHRDQGIKRLRELLT